VKGSVFLSNKPLPSLMRWNQEIFAAIKMSTGAYGDAQRSWQISCFRLTASPGYDTAPYAR